LLKLAFIREHRANRPINLFGECFYQEHQNATILDLLLHRFGKRNGADMPGADFSQWVTPAAMAEVIGFLAAQAAAPIHGAAVPVGGLQKKPGSRRASVPTS